jgi:beta-fructofuranosidase
VACNVGDLAGGRFRAGTWQRFTATDALYATTTFLDAQGRRGAGSWVREPAPPGPQWAGVLSLPVLLGLDGERVTVTPHPDVDTLRAGVRAHLGPAVLDAEPRELGPFEPFLDVVLEPDPATDPVRLVVAAADTEILGVLVDPVAGVLELHRPGRPGERLAYGGGDVRLLLDAGLAEVFSGGAAGAVRVTTGSPVTLRLSAPRGSAGLRGFTAHAMPVSR